MVSTTCSTLSWALFPPLLLREAVLRLARVRLGPGAGRRLAARARTRDLLVDERVEAQHREHELRAVAGGARRVAERAARKLAVEDLDQGGEGLGRPAGRHRLEPLFAGVEHGGSAAPRPVRHDLRAAPGALVVRLSVALVTPLAVRGHRCDHDEVVRDGGGQRERVDGELLHGLHLFRNRDPVDPDVDGPKQQAPVHMRPYCTPSGSGAR